MHIKIFNKYKEEKLKGRYITFDMIKELLNSTTFNKKILGYSFLKKEVFALKLGSGKIKILIWTQMHGNESTGTKAVFDLLNYLSDTSNNDILKKCTIQIVPILNPDGALKFTRVNAQGIDLNRDAVSLEAPESIILNKLIQSFKPSYCFNLHDQRTLFSVGEQNLPATISFLAPSEDIDRTVTDGRVATMKVIVAMNSVIERYIPGQIGRYTDEFYPTATGDNFQKAGFNTVLIEAGHFPNDYEREETRKYNFIALLSGITYIVNQNIAVDYKDYFNIPNNKKGYYKIILNNVLLAQEKVKVGIYLDPYLNEKVVHFKKKYEILSLKSNYRTKRLISERLIFEDTLGLMSYIYSL